MYYTFWNVKCAVWLFMLEKPNLRFNIGSITVKATIELSGKEIKKYPRNFFMIIIALMII